MPKVAARRRARKPKAVDLVEKHREAIGQVLDLLDKGRATLEEPDPDRPGATRLHPLPPIPRDNPENWKLIADRIEAGATVEQARHVLRVRWAAIQAGDPAGRSYFDAITPFRPQWFAASLGTDEAAARARVRADLERRAPRPARLAPGNAKPTKSEAEIIAAQEADMNRRRREQLLAKLSPEDRAKAEELERRAAEGAA